MVAVNCWLIGDSCDVWDDRFGGSLIRCASKWIFSFLEGFTDATHIRTG